MYRSDFLFSLAQQLQRGHKFLTIIDDGGKLSLMLDDGAETSTETDKPHIVIQVNRMIAGLYVDMTPPQTTALGET